MSAIFSPHGGICIRLSVLQSSHRPAPGFRAKSWLKVQSSIEQRESNTNPFPCHLPSCLHCYLWLFMIGLAISASVYAVWLTLYATHPSVHFLKQLTATLRRGVFVRLMNQRCIQQPNRCCSPPVSREMPTVSCTGHLAPWCLSLFIVRGFPITRAGRGHFLSTLSTERCVHNAWRCHGAREAESGPCSAWSCPDSWAEEWETEQESLERIWSSSVVMLIHKFEPGLWALGDVLIYRAFKVVRFYIIALCGLRER